ncbi:MAG: phytanoyl-CoA dioxygenase family protein [Planctomycetaceae bacterium]|nr:phytanoyl-CoA dioxygenase family protein [Planctomycetaceae bacterium]
MTLRLQLDRDGGVVLIGVINRRRLDWLSALLALLPRDEAVRERDGAVYASRNVLELCPALIEAWRTERLTELLGDVLGAEVGLVRGLYFDKPPQQTWALPWHKDLTIAVREPIEAEGYSKPRLRAGVWHCEPPVEVLQAMLTLRIHLDEVTEENGPLQVLSGSHRTGKPLRIDDFQPQPVLVNAGDVFAMRPLLAHCSGRSREGTQRHRRVLHLEFAGMPKLPGGHEWHAFHPVT